MNNPKVSVIIPVYNTEPYVEAALRCITQQTLSEIEIIIINDGSTDNSLAIVNKIAGEDKRVLVFTQENQGLSMARNAGVSRATGEFIYFMDSDDLLEIDTLELCYAKCTREELDFVFFDADLLVDSSMEQYQWNYIRTKDIPKDIHNGADMLAFQLKHHKYKSPVWLNFIRHTFIKGINLTFYPGINHEDELYTPLLYLNATRVGFISRAFFKRRIRQASIMTQAFSRKNLVGYFTVANELVKYKKTKSTYIKEIIDLFLTETLNAVLWRAHVMSFKDKMYIIRCCICKYYLKYISFRTLCVMFLRKKK